MSLAINVDKVDAVLIAGEWYTVEEVEKGLLSFEIDSYEFLSGGGRLIGSMNQSPSGFMFRTIIEGVPSWIYGPITAIQGVRIEEK